MMKNEIRYLSVRISKSLHLKLSRLCFDKDIPMQSWIIELIEKEIERERERRDVSPA